MTFSPRMASSRIPLKLSQFAKLFQPSGTCNVSLSQPRQEWCNKIKLLRHLLLRARQFCLSSDLLTFQSWRESSISFKLFWPNIGVVVNKSLQDKIFLVVVIQVFRYILNIFWKILMFYIIPLNSNNIHKSIPALFWSVLKCFAYSL